MQQGPATQAAVDSVVQALKLHGRDSIVALAGPPATGKTHVARIAAQVFAGEPTRVTPFQFHPNYTYEQFVSGLKLRSDGSVGPIAGEFLEVNRVALDDGVLQYVVLIDEFTRADVPAVMGELLTYLEYRGESFRTLYGGPAVKLAENLAVLVTYNPVDRSALEIDDALIRRMEILTFGPDTGQLRDMLTGRLPDHVITQLTKVFDACQATHTELYDELMPFGHGVFAGVKNESDLHSLWQNRLRHILFRPGLTHPFATTIEGAYPWTDKTFTSPLV